MKNSSHFTLVSTSAAELPTPAELDDFLGAALLISVS